MSLSVLDEAWVSAAWAQEDEAKRGEKRISGRKDGERVAE
jgi:hypothetical protein